MIGIPDDWYELDQNNSTILVYEIMNRTDINWARYLQLSATVVNNDDMTEINIIGPYYNFQDFFDSIVFLPYDIDETTVGGKSN